MNLHKARFSTAALALALLLMIASTGWGAEIPALRGRINDYAQMLSRDVARNLENQLEQFERQTGHQVALLTIPSLGGEDIEGFSIRVAETWKIGQKGFDNGVIFVVAPQDRQLRLEVGYGLEGVLPDAVASRIIREIVVPRFRDNDYEGGITSGLNAVLTVIRGEPLPETARQRPRGKTPVTGLGIPLLLLLLFLAGSFSRRRNTGTWMTRGRHRPFGWGAGFGGGGFPGGFGSGGFGGGGGFSGGGGGFGGGGASGRW
ncbi:MAG TPA: TPM domain-containing protein [Candidatus Binatia bacterium]|nr:TPM domain-containing protein [Candidatus Binatia bacterium]